MTIRSVWRALLELACVGAIVVVVNHTAWSQAGTSQSGTWTDPATSLMWALQDNGKAVNWDQANNYCRTLSLAGFKNWQLPTLDELVAMRDPNRANRMHIKGGIQLTGWEWSSNTEKEGGIVTSARTFDFGMAMRGSYPAIRLSQMRALCVRPVRP
jgi:hypothetical protein